MTVEVARAAFPRGNRYLTLRDTFGPLFTDEDFADLYSHRGRPAYPPGRLAGVLVLQFMENLSDRKAADAVRARLDWKYLLGLPLSDPGFDASILSEFRTRLARSDAGQTLFDRLVEPLRTAGYLRGRTRQRTDCTHVLAAVRALNRLELIAETVRATLNELAREDPGWLRRFLQPEHIRRYNAPADEMRLPQSKASRKKLTIQIGHDGINLLTAIDSDPHGEHLQTLPAVQVLRAVWNPHFEWNRHFEQLNLPTEERNSLPTSPSCDSREDLRPLRFRDTKDLKPSPNAVFLRTIRMHATVYAIAHGGPTGCI